MVQPKCWRWFLWGSRVYGVFLWKGLTPLSCSQHCRWHGGTGAMVLHRKATVTYNFWKMPKGLASHSALSLLNSWHPHADSTLGKQSSGHRVEWQKQTQRGVERSRRDPAWRRRSNLRPGWTSCPSLAPASLSGRETSLSAATVLGQQ